MLVDERDVKLAAVREWLNQEYSDMPYFSIVRGIRSVLDWKMDAQDRDNEILEAVRKDKKKGGGRER